jgi:hypothetical protein
MNITELENEIALLNAARYADGPNKGRRLVEVDRPYARDVFQKQIDLANLKTAEAKQVRIGEHQLHGLNNYDRMQGDANVKALQGAMGAKNPANGRRWVEEKPALRVEIEKGLGAVMHGERFSMSPELSAIVGAK